jgi:hypothetical protein
MNGSRTQSCVQAIVPEFACAFDTIGADRLGRNKRFATIEPTEAACRCCGMMPTMKDNALVRWRRRAIEAKKLAQRFRTPFAKRGMLRVVATYKWLARRAAKRKLAARLAPKDG